MSLVPKGRSLRIAVIAVAVIAVAGLAYSILAGPAPRREARLAFGIQAVSASFVAPSATSGPQVDVLLLSGGVDEHAVLRVIDALADEAGESTVTVALRGGGKGTRYEWSRGSKVVVKYEGDSPVSFAAPLTVADFSMLDSSDWRPEFRPWSEWEAYAAEAAAKAEEAERKRIEESEYEGEGASQPGSAAPLPEIVP